jgi:AraC-like DNA-binding protein
MTVDLEEGSPAGTIYGEYLANALAVYLLKRYAVRRLTPVVCKGGLPGYRLKRVLDYIANNLEENISLSQLAAAAGMSPHYFSELFKQSTGRSPHKLCSPAEDGTCQGTASRPQVQRHRSGPRRRISKLESFRPHLSRAPPLQSSERIMCRGRRLRISSWRGRL